MTVDFGILALLASTIAVVSASAIISFFWSEIRAFEPSRVAWLLISTKSYNCVDLRKIAILSIRLVLKRSQLALFISNR